MALVVVGCAAAPADSPSPPADSPSPPPFQLAGDGIGTPCAAEDWIDGVIVVGPPNGLAGIRDDQGNVTQLVWGMRNRARVELGHRYKLGGKLVEWPGLGKSLWTCAGEEAVIPE